MRMRIPRMSMLRSMVLIGALATWLWLTRTNGAWMACGSLVLALMLLAAGRRSRMAAESANAGGERPTSLSRAGIFGYSLAVLLGLAWIVSVLVWDAYERDRRVRGDLSSIARAASDFYEWALRPSPRPGTFSAFGTSTIIRRRVKPSAPAGTPPPGSIAPP